MNFVNLKSMDEGARSGALEAAHQDDAAPSVSSNYVSGQVRTLQALHDSLFAPQFRALENYAAVEKVPTVETVREALTAALRWQRDNEVKLACEVSERRKASSNSILLDEAVRDLNFCRSEIERIKAEIANLQVETDRKSLSENGQEAALLGQPNATNSGTNWAAE